ncbi:MAG: GNAT family N-acetyltransferase [Pseudomonadota bacterium]
MITVGPGDPSDPDAAALLKASHALMESLFPAETNHFLSIDALCTPDIRFYVARDEGRIVGTGALAVKDGYGELKSMFVDPEIRGKGAGEALVTELIVRAELERLPMLKLETGSLLHAAHRLYERAGFTRCGPFGDYEDGEFSVFMEMAL